MDLEDQAWEAYTARRAAAAVTLFFEAMAEDPGDPEVRFGFVRSLIMAGRLEEAQEHLREYEALEPDEVDLKVVEAELLGALGQRVKASQVLGQALFLEPGEPLALGLMGEQKVRLGDWDGGVEYFSKALNSPDREGFALHHFQGVAQALVAAVGQKKVGLEEASTFFHRVSAETPQSLSWMWKTIASSLKTGRPVRFAGAKPVSGALTQAPPEQARRAGATPPGPRGAVRLGAGERVQPSRPAPPAGQSKFIASLQEERVLNQALQQEIGPMPVASWPSGQAWRLDQVVLQVHKGGQAALGMGSFHVTGGNIFTELYLDRCKEAMLAVLPDEELNPMLPSRGGVERLELNLREHLPGELEVMREDLKVGDLIASDPLTAAVGSFLGQVVCEEHRGVWRFEADPERSSVRVGGREVYPLRFAAGWLGEVRGGQEARLADFLWEVEHGSGLREGMGQERFIDPTKELVDRALVLGLANQWGMYRLSLLRTSSAKIAAGMEVAMALESGVVVRLDRTWLPKQPIDPESLWQGRASLFYVRDSGAWLPLWHRGAAEEAMGVVSPQGKGEDAAALIKIATCGYKQHEKVMDSAEALGAMPPRLRERMGLPGWVTEQGGQRRLEFWSVDQEGGPVGWVLRQRAGAQKGWEIDFKGM